MKKIKITPFCISWLLFILWGIYVKSWAKDQIIFKNAIYLKKTVETLLLEFNKIPKYNLEKTNKKLKITLFDTIPGDFSWIKKLPNDIFQEINVSIEKNRLALEFVLTRDFNFQAIPSGTRLSIELLWKKKGKPVFVKITGKKVKEEPILSLPLKTIAGSGFPQYEVPTAFRGVKLEIPLAEKKYTGIPISVDFQNADIHAVLRFLAEIGGINIVVSDKVKGTVTLKLNHVPWDEVLDLVLSSNGLAKIKIGNVIKISTLQELKQEAEWYKDYITTIAQEKEGLKKEAESYTNYLKAIRDMQEEGPLVTKIFHLKFINVEKVIDRKKGQTIIEKLKELIKSPSKITCDPRTNVLIVKATPKVLKEIENIIKTIDKPRKQVLIEARIVEIGNNYIHQLGIKWGGMYYKSSEHTFVGITPGGGGINYAFSGYNSASLSITAPPSAIVDLGISGATTNLGIILGWVENGLLTLDAQLSALEQQGVARVVSKPTIITLDRETAEIKQGYKIPYLVYVPNVATPTTSFIDAGLKLDVTPHITPEGKILLDLTIEKTTPDWAHNVQGVPSLYTHTIQTSAMVNNGETLVIGGIKIKDISETVDSVPGLSRLPLIGELFKRHSKSMSNTELLIFITPKIISVEVKGVDY